MATSTDAGAAAPTSTPRRPQEKPNRVSTCSFSDRVAQLSIAKFRELLRAPDVDPRVAQQLGGSEYQTVLATVLVHNENAVAPEQRLVVASLGVGTKFESDEAVEAARHEGNLVHDGHAEVLARRSLVAFLYRDCRRALVAAGGEGLAVKFRAESKRFQIRHGVTFHLYTSSAPCGNSCMRRGAKSQRERYNADLSEDAWPDTAAHAQFAVKGADLRHVAVLAKSLGGTPGDGGGGDDFVPPGTAVPGTPKLATQRACCSAKIARWTALGMEGALLRALFVEADNGPVVRLCSLTVGRKFSRRHLERAVCCRLAPLSRKVRAEHTGRATRVAVGPQYPHVSVMCTAVQLHTGSYEGEGSGAQFSDCVMCWALLCGAAPQIWRMEARLVVVVVVVVVVVAVVAAAAVGVMLMMLVSMTRCRSCRGGPCWSSGRGSCVSSGCRRHQRTARGTTQAFPRGTRARSAWPQRRI